MDSRNRTVWIVVIILVGLLLCCCVLIVAAAAAGLLTTIPISREVGFGRVEEGSEQIFTVGASPLLEVDSFAGEVSVRSGESGQIRVNVTKVATSDTALDRIDVDVSEHDEGVRIRTSSPGTLSSNMSVRLDIVVPPDARLDLDTDAGTVRVDDVRGEISAHTGAGNVRVQGAVGPVALDTGAGEVNYEGQPTGACSFSTGAGSITLSLPEDVDVEIRLNTGIGSINLGGFDVEGDTSGTEVDGVIGSGEDGRIEARTGAGSITLVRQ